MVARAGSNRSCIRMTTACIELQMHTRLYTYANSQVRQLHHIFSFEDLETLNIFFLSASAYQKI